MTALDQPEAESQEVSESTLSGWLRRGGLIVAGAFLVVCTYVLSIGPVIKLIDLQVLPEEASITYAPLEEAFRGSPVVRRFFNWYLKDVWKA